MQRFDPKELPHEYCYHDRCAIDCAATHPHRLTVTDGHIQCQHCKAMDEEPNFHPISETEVLYQPGPAFRSGHGFVRLPVASVRVGFGHPVQGVVIERSLLSQD